MKRTTIDLVADIGGTNTRIALAHDGRLQPETIQRYKNAEHHGFKQIIESYFQSQNISNCRGVCVAVAGPVRNGKGGLTNLDWQMSEIELKRWSRAKKAFLLNDLQAQGYGLSQLSSAQTKILLKGKEAEAGATKLVVGIGTGFNIAPVYHHQDHVLVPPSEAGHAGLPLNPQLDPEFVAFLESIHGFASVEDLMSGRGFERIFQMLSGEAVPASEIMTRFNTKDDKSLRDAIAQFVTMIGSITGDFALIHLPFGGIYFVGGVSRSLGPFFDAFGFATSFRNKGRFSEFMDNFPIYLVEDDFAALNGCVACIKDQI